MTTTHKLLLRFSLAGAVLLAAVAAPAQKCSNQSLKGSFGYTVTGSITQTVGPLAPGAFGAVGRLVFDGAGHVSTVRSLSDAGHVLRDDAGSGTYALDSDCTGFFNITVGPPGNTVVLNLDIVLDDLYELRGVVTNTGTVLTLEGRKQYPANY